jgi:predicted secreted protein
MATTGIVNGTLMCIYVNTVKVAVLTSNSFSQSRGTRETANKSSATWMTRIPVRGSWSASGSAYFQFDDTATDGFSYLKTLMDAKTQITCLIGTDVVADKYYSGSGYITELSADFPDDEGSTYSFSIEGDGALTEYATT